MTFSLRPRRSRGRAVSPVAEYRLTRVAEDDLLDAFLYGFETFGPGQADGYRQGMARCFELHADTPRLGRPADDFIPGARRHEHGRHVIFYDEQPYGVLMIAVVRERSVHRWLKQGG